MFDRMPWYERVVHDPRYLLGAVGAALLVLIGVAAFVFVASGFNWIVGIALFLEVALLYGLVEAWRRA